MTTATSRPANCGQAFDLLAANGIHVLRERATDRQRAMRGVGA
jgi:hypothetical protein